MKKAGRIRRHRVLGVPYLGSLLAVLWSVVVLIVVQIPFYLMGNERSFQAYSSTTVCFAAMILAAILVLIIHRLWFRGEYRGSFRRGTSFHRSILVPLIVFCVLDIIDWVIGISRMGFSPLTLKSFTESVAAGVVEETMFRVLVISIFMRRLKDKDSYLPALILSSVVFGLVHLANASGAAGAPLATVLMQAVGTIACGAMFGAVYLRTGSVLLPMVVHALHDIFSVMVLTQSTGLMMFDITAFDLIDMAVMSLIEFAVAFWLLKGRKQEIMDVWKERWNTPAPAAAEEA